MYKTILFCLMILSLCNISLAQSIDIFALPGSDFAKPGMFPRGNYTIGIGYSNIKALTKSPIGNELVLSYTYENKGTHGFLHTDQGSHTVALGTMRSFPLAFSKMGLYSWTMAGVTSLTGTPHAIQNRLYQGDAIGFTYLVSPHNSFWMQEQYNKVETTTWYTSFSLGYDYWR